MKRVLFSFTLALGSFVGSILSSEISRAELPPVQPVPKLEVQRYLGRWYDVRSIPNRFQNGCVNTTADYALIDSDTLSVINRCDQVDDAGQIEDSQRVKGKAWIKSESNSILKVSFACLFGICIETFGGDYWVLGLGPLNADGLYSWAIVGTPDRKFGWVLARTPELSTDTLAEIETVLRAQSYDPTLFQITRHGVK